jgi:hypothetical protein
VKEPTVTDPDRDVQEVGSDDVGQLSEVLGDPDAAPLDRPPQPDPDQPDGEDGPEE